MSRKIVLDNCVLSWAFQSENCVDYSDERVLRAKRLIEKIDNDGDEIVIPSIVLFEFLSIFNEEEHEARENLIKSIAPHIKICEFGHSCAVKSSELFKLSKDPDNKSAIDETNRTSSQRKTDIMILGQAHSNGIECIFTGDDKFIAIANILKGHHSVDVSQMPESDEITIEDCGVKI